MLNSIHQSKDCALYQVAQKPGETLETIIASTPLTREICNDPLVFGVNYTRRLRTACSNIMQGLQNEGHLSLEEKETIVFNILRGGLNFGLREALAEAFDWNLHGSSFISAQRARNSSNSEDWHIVESEYQKVYMPKCASIVLGDVVATGTSLQHALDALLQSAQDQGTELKSILFFTYGGERSREILSRVDRICREKFPNYERTTLVFLEGIFTIPTPDYPQRVKITGTDLLRYKSLMAPEFVESQYLYPSFPLERCTIYDAGSRAFWLPEYLEDVYEYWEQNLALAREGVSFEELLKERFPRLDASRYGDVNLEKLCLSRLEKLATHR